MSKVKTQLVIDGKNNSKKAFNEVDKDFNSLAAGAKKVGTAIGAALGSGALARWVTESARAVAEMSRLAKLSNTTSESFQRWAYAARTVGIEQDKLGDIFKDVQDKVGDFLQTGGGPLADFFEKIAPAAGVTAAQFRNLSGPDALQLYVKTLEGANLSQSEMTFYLEAIANDAALLAPLLANNGEKLEQMGEQASNLGRILDDETTKSIERFHLSLKDLEGSASGVGDQFTGVVSELDELTGATKTASGQLDRLSRVLKGVSSTKSPGWVERFFQNFKILSSAPVLDTALDFLLWGPKQQKQEADQHDYREDMFKLHNAEMALLRAKDIADTEASQKRVIAGAEAVLKKQVALEKAAASDLEKAKRAQLDTYKRYAEALASINAGSAGEPSYGAAQSLKVGAREALRSGDIEGAKQQAQAALKMLQDIASAGGNTYGFEGFIKELQAIEETADSQMLDGMQKAFDKAQAGAQHLKAELDKLKNSPVSVEMDQASLDAVKEQITRLAGEKIVIPVTFEGGGLDVLNPYTLQDPGPAPQKFATGGYISGPGTSTSDSIPALLSNGEYVIRAAAVRKFGLQNLDWINKGLPIPRFADGGLVGAVSNMAVPRAEHVGSIDISLDGSAPVTLSGAPDALKELANAARKFGRTHR